MDAVGFYFILDQLVGSTAGKEEQVHKNIKENMSAYHEMFFAHHSLEQKSTDG